MGNNICSPCKQLANQSNEIRHDNIVYTDSTYNIWDNNPIRSLNSFQSQMTFSNNLNRQVSSFQKGQYQTITSPKNNENKTTQAESQNAFSDKLTQSQINIRLEILQDQMKKQHSVIQEESEQDTIVDFQNSSMKNFNLESPQKAGPSNFCSKKLMQNEEQCYSQINDKETEENQSISQPIQTYESQQQNTQILLNQEPQANNEKYEESFQPQQPSQSLKYMNQDNNQIIEEKAISETILEEVEQNGKQNQQSQQKLK